MTPLATPYAINSYFKSTPSFLGSPAAQFGRNACTAEITATYATPKFAILEVALRDPKAPGYCSINALLYKSTLESPVGTHKFRRILDEEATLVPTYAKKGLHYVVYERGSATDEELRRAVINPLGSRSADAPASRSRDLGTQHIPALKTMLELQSSYSRPGGIAAEHPSAWPSEFEDGSGRLWFRCPATLQGDALVRGLPASDGACSKPVKLNFFDAVVFASKVGDGWRLPAVAEALALKNEARAATKLQSCSGLPCLGHYTSYMRENYLGVLGEFWGDTIYTAADKRVYRTQEVLGSAITTDIHVGGNWPVKGYDEEPYQKLYMIYLIKSTATNSNWERTKKLVLSERLQLEAASSAAKREEADREAQDRAELGRVLFGGGSASSSDSSSDSSSRSNSDARTYPYVCEFKCKDGDWQKLNATGRSAGQAATSIHDKVEQVCRSYGKVQDRGWGIECKSK